jgi:hypothetical protein
MLAAIVTAKAGDPCPVFGRRVASITFPEKTTFNVRLDSARR